MRLQGEIKIGDFIKRAREKQNITQRCLAEKIGVKQAVVCMWERDKRFPSLEMLCRLKKIGIDAMKKIQEQS